MNYLETQMTRDGLNRLLREIKIGMQKKNGVLNL